MAVLVIERFKYYGLFTKLNKMNKSIKVYSKEIKMTNELTTEQEEIKCAQRDLISASNRMLAEMKHFECEADLPAFLEVENLFYELSIKLGNFIAEPSKFVRQEDN